MQFAESESLFTLFSARHFHCYPQRVLLIVFFLLKCKISTLSCPKNVLKALIMHDMSTLTQDQTPSQSGLRLHQTGTQTDLKSD